MKRILIISGVLVVVLVIAGGALMWYWMQQPLYQPGMVRAGKNLRAPLDPPAQLAAADFWAMESDVQLYHQAQGSGRNVLVVHGGPGNPFSAPLPALAPLASRYRFIYYDQRGSGRSSRPIERFASSNTYENMTALDRTLGLGAQLADVERIRRILGDDKLILVGHSFGGMLASLYAAEFPDHVQALVLIAPAETLVMPPEGGGLFEEVKPLLPQDMRAEYEAYLKRYLDYGRLFSRTEQELVSLNAEFVRYYAPAAARKGFSIPAESQPVQGGGWMVHAMYVSMGLRHDYRAALKAVKAPVLVLHGDKDLQPETASRMYAAAFPNAQFEVVPNAGHFLFSDQPEAFARLVSEFLTKVSQS